MMPPGVRKLALTVHLTSSIGWIGAVIAYLALDITAASNGDVERVRSAWTAMDVTGWWVIVPLAVTAVLTGLVMSLGTRWGLFRHYWTLISLVLTLLCTFVLVLHMPSVSRMADIARQANGAELRGLGGDLTHPAVGLLILLAITVLNVYKPAGVTPYGWRKQREQRQAHRRGVVSVTRIPVGRSPSREVLGLTAAATGVLSFIFHFAEMWFVMMLGMMLFIPFRVALIALGQALLVDGSTITAQVWMWAFMVVPTVLWMRIRGGGWRLSAEMGAGMLVPVAGVLALGGIGVLDVLPWLENSDHALMLVGMFAVMLYRRQHYTRGHWLSGWLGLSSPRSGAGLAGPRPRSAISQD